MTYRCPVKSCGKLAISATNLARHMSIKFDSEHTDWMERNGIAPLEVVGVEKKGNMRPLIELLERVARLTE